MMIKRLINSPDYNQLVTTTVIIMVSVFVFEVIITCVRILFPPLSGIGEFFLNSLFLLIATICTIYLFIFRSRLRDITKRRSKENLGNNSNSPEERDQRSISLPLLTPNKT